MTTLDETLSSPDDTHLPQIPDPFSLQLTEEAVLELQRILEQETGHSWTLAETRQHGLELMRLTFLMLDPEGFTHWMENPPAPIGFVLETPVPRPDPVPRPYPIDFDADHEWEIERNLRMVADELKYVKRRPGNWRWAIVALYNALGHALAMHIPTGRRPEPDVGQLMVLFDIVSKTHGSIAPDRYSVLQLNLIRTKWIAEPIARWPINAGLSPLFERCEACICALLNHGPDGPASLSQGSDGSTDGGS